MKRLLTIIICAFALLVITTSHAQATLIVDTGTPTNTYGLAGTDLEFAGLISISEALTISRIEGYFQQETNNPFSVSLYIYNGTDINPDYDIYAPHNKYPKGDPIDLGDFVVPVHSSSGPYSGWFGLDRSYTLGPGNYWISFGGTFTMGMYAPNPLANYAQAVGPQWYPYYAAGSEGGPSYHGWGLRVYSESGGTDPVPEPATMLLLGLGLMGLAGVRRKLQK